jgi:hypothetical protein
MHEQDTRFDLMHHFKKNIAPKDKCNLDTSAGNPMVQRTTAGIIEIVEAENVQVDLDDEIGFAAIIRKVVEDMGFTVTIDSIHGEEGDLSVVIMEQGYVAARLWPKEKFVGFDINLWGRTFLVKNLKLALAKAVGSKDVSSYKVVVGGMYGFSMWKEDQGLIGPKIRQLRNCEEDVVHEGNLDEALACAVSVKEVVPLTLAKDITAAVICGKKNEECPSLKALEGHTNVKNVLTIHECPELDEPDMVKQINCETRTLQVLMEAHQANGSKLNLLVLDGSASYKMHQILNSIMMTDQTHATLFEQHSITVTFSPNLIDQTWRREFLDRLRMKVEYDPAVRAEIVFQAGGKSYEMGIFSSGNENVRYDLANCERRIRDQLSESGATIELRNIHGALYQFINDYNPKEFNQEDYDSKPGRVQYANQAPLARQTIMQFVKNENKGEGLNLKLDNILGFVKGGLQEVGMKTTLLRKYPVADGGIILGLSIMGQVIAVWDGQLHVDVNLFTYNQGAEIPELFKQGFLDACENNLVLGLRDDQPRGIGKVINFLDDMLYEG